MSKEIQINNMTVVMTVVGVDIGGTKVKCWQGTWRKLIRFLLEQNFR